MAKEELVYDVDAEKFLSALASELKKNEIFVVPEWAYFVKTSMSKQRPPEDKGWWYTRAASILRQMYTRGIVGVGRLRVKYGSKKNRGMRPSRFKKGAGKNIRMILQQTEAAGFVEKTNKGKRAGRKLTTKGREFLDNLAKSLK
ncbi:MAG: 30S ribosomal protein S19e [archaeon]